MAADAERHLISTTRRATVCSATLPYSNTPPWSGYAARDRIALRFGRVVVHPLPGEVAALLLQLGQRLDERAIGRDLRVRRSCRSTRSADPQPRPFLVAGVAVGAEHLLRQLNRVREIERLLRIVPHPEEVARRRGERRVRRREDGRRPPAGFLRKSVGRLGCSASPHPRLRLTAIRQKAQRPARRC